MPAPLSKDLRKRIIESRAKGDSIEQISREKNVSESTITKLLRKYRERKTKAVNSRASR